MKQTLSGCILALILASIGCCLGYAWYINDLEPGDTWKSLGAPPSQVIHLLSAHDSTVYVQTIDHKIYSCYHESQYDRSCWNRVDTIPEDSLGPKPYPFQSPIPPISDKVLESLAVRYAPPGLADDGPYIFAYALLSDGTVIQWFSDSLGWFPPPNQLIRFILKTLGGFIIGSLIVPFTLILGFMSRKITRLI